MSKIAITGGTGFVGSALDRLLRSQGHETALISRRAGVDLDDVVALTKALEGCDAVAHLAGINREIGAQTYERVHVRGTANVIAAAKANGISRVVMLSFLRARPHCGSPYHESKFAAQELIRTSGLAYTVVKAGVIYGRGDHMLDHISRALFTMPLFAAVGFHQPPLRPIAVQDVAAILAAALTSDELLDQTVAVVGPETLTVREVVHRIAAAAGRRVLVFPMPVAFHRLLARGAELVMKVPLVSLAQVRILQEGLIEPSERCDPLPEHLIPRRQLTIENIRRELPPPARFSCGDLRMCSSTAH
jgi:NADH dehydrogenase